MSWRRRWNAKTVHKVMLAPKEHHLLRVALHVLAYAIQKSTVTIKAQGTCFSKGEAAMECFEVGSLSRAEGCELLQNIASLEDRGYHKPKASDIWAT